MRRRSRLTLYPNRPPQVGTATEHPGCTESGVVIDGFVERLGGPGPLIAADGSAHRPELLLVNAIDALVDATGGAARVAIGVPAQWQPPTRELLQHAMSTHAVVSMLGGPPYLVSDAVAALTSVQAEHALPPHGVLALLDFGGGGTSITLADAAAGFQPIGETRRYHRFSGNGIDQAILGYVLGSDPGNGTAAAGTALVGDVAHLAEECRQAKEQLSVQTATELVLELPGYRTRIALTRAELEQLIGRSLDGVLVALEDLLERNRIGWNDLGALVAVGGGAQIPLISHRLSAQRRVPVLTVEQPAVAAAAGATLCAQRAGGLRTAAPALALTATAATTPADVRLGGTGLDRRGPDPVIELAWSQEEVRDEDEPVPFYGDPYKDPYEDPYGDPYSDPYSDGDRPAGTAPPPRRRPVGRVGRRRRAAGLSQFMVGMAMVIAATGLAGLTYSVMRAQDAEDPSHRTVNATVPEAPPSPQPAEPAPAPPPAVATNSAAPEPTPPPAATHEPSTATHQPATTTAAPVPTTTQPPTPASTQPSPTPTPSSAPTASSPSAAPPSSTEAATPTTAPMRTEYLRIPLVPVPIPIQVPAN